VTDVHLSADYFYQPCLAQNNNKEDVKDCVGKNSEEKPENYVDLVLNCASGFEVLLFDEVRSLLSQKFLDQSFAIKQRSSGVELKAPLVAAYYLCLWSLIAEQVLVKLAAISLHEKEQSACRDYLYQKTKDIPWEQFFSVDSLFKIEATGKQAVFHDGRFAALVCKDAIADRFRFHFEKRPSVARENPDVIVQLYGEGNNFQLYFNISGERLHKRGYRQASLDAPLRETLAAALLRKMNWHEQYQQLSYFLDPCCGSGTLAIEALMVAADIAPNLLRAEDLDRSFAFEKLYFYQKNIGLALINEAQQRKQDGIAAFQESGLKIRGYDSNMQAIKIANENLALLDLSAFVHFERRSFHQIRALSSASSSVRADVASKDKGMLLCNPPYGERLQEADELKYLYRFLGERARQLFSHWIIGVICSQVELLDALALKNYQQSRFYNGNLNCIFRYAELNPVNENKTIAHMDNSNKENYFLEKLYELKAQNNDATIESELEIDLRALDFKNRLLKNLRKLSPWINRQGIQNFRLYDADMPEFNAAIDCYHSWQGAFLVIAEYAAPKSIDEAVAKERFTLLVQTVRKVFSLQREHVFIKTRFRQKGNTQYLNKSDAKKREDKKKKGTRYLNVQENGLNFLINPIDYLDIGLFIDHRRVRKLIQNEVKGKRFLNLYAYTGSASVYAAAGGAKTSLSVDLSENYLKWARMNLLANGFSLESHNTHKADTLQYLQNSKEQFDIIFIDPPTFSNSKKKNLNFDVQSDHEALIKLAMARLDGAGKLYFSTNYRSFVFSQQLSERFQVEEITEKTVSPDFSRKISHRCWQVTR